MNLRNGPCGPKGSSPIWFHGGIIRLQCFDVGVDHGKGDAGNAVAHHALHTVTSAAADADDLDPGRGPLIDIKFDSGLVFFFLLMMSVGDIVLNCHPIS